jgi:hypothetical protein
MPQLSGSWTVPLFQAMSLSLEEARAALRANYLQAKAEMHVKAFARKLINRHEPKVPPPEPKVPPPEPKVPPPEHLKARSVAAKREARARSVAAKREARARSVAAKREARARRVAVKQELYSEDEQAAVVSSWPSSTQLAVAPAPTTTFTGCSLVARKKPKEEEPQEAGDQDGRLDNWFETWECPTITDCMQWVISEQTGAEMLIVRYVEGISQKSCQHAKAAIQQWFGIDVESMLIAKHDIDEDFKKLWPPALVRRFNSQLCYLGQHERPNKDLFSGVGYATNDKKRSQVTALAIVMNGILSGLEPFGSMDEDECEKVIPGLANLVHAAYCSKPSHLLMEDVPAQPVMDVKNELGDDVEGHGWQEDDAEEDHTCYRMCADGGDEDHGWQGDDAEEDHTWQEDAPRQKPLPPWRSKQEPQELEDPPQHRRPMSAKPKQKSNDKVGYTASLKRRRRMGLE